MKKGVLFCLLFTLSAHSCDEYSGSIGSSLFYTRFHQGCPQEQKGFLAGPHFDFEWTRPGFLYAGLFFDGLWKIGHICSKDGLFADNNQYDVRLKLGYPCDSIGPCGMRIVPHVGVGFIHLSHEIEPCLIRYKYNHVYVPIGFTLSNDFSDLISWELHAYYRIDAWTRLKVTTPNVCDTKDSKIRLKRAHGIHVALPIFSTYCANDRFEVEFGWCPTFDWQKFPEARQCEGTTTPPVPELKTWKLGNKMLIGIRF